MIDITEDDKLTALAMEAGRRGISYGRLMATTTPEERKKIITLYLVNKQKKKDRG